MKKNVEDYLKDPNHCPVCGGADISANNDFVSVGASAHQTVECENCGATWYDIYTITGVEIIKTKKETN